MVMESSHIRSLRHTLTLPHTAKQKIVSTDKDKECQLEKSQVQVVVKAINGATQVRYIQPDSRHYNKHEQLKQHSLNQRKNKRGPGSKSDQ